MGRKYLQIIYHTSENLDPEYVKNSLNSTKKNNPIKKKDQNIQFTKDYMDMRNKYIKMQTETIMGCHYILSECGGGKPDNTKR